MNHHPRTYSRITHQTLALLGGRIRLARKQRKMSEADLAERVGIARSTLQAIEKGHPTVEIGLVFEAATLVGVPLFVDTPARLGTELARVSETMALLPRSVRRARGDLNDDF